MAPPGHPGILPHVQPRVPWTCTHKHDRPSPCFGHSARLHPYSGSSLVRLQEQHRLSTFHVPGAPRGSGPPTSSLDTKELLREFSFSGRTARRGHYLAGRAGRAPWAAAPSCCSPGRSGPSWRWTTGPGSAGSRPVPSCSGTRLPAGASWTLGDTTEPNNPEKLPGQAPSPLTADPDGTLLPGRLHAREKHESSPPKSPRLVPEEPGLCPPPRLGPLRLLVGSLCPLVHPVVPPLLRTH